MCELEDSQGCCSYSQCSRMQLSWKTEICIIRFEFCTEGIDPCAHKEPVQMSAVKDPGMDHMFCLRSSNELRLQLYVKLIKPIFIHSLVAVLVFKEAVLLLQFHFEGYLNNVQKANVWMQFLCGGCSTNSLMAASTTDSMLLMVLKFT